MKVATDRFVGESDPTAAPIALIDRRRIERADATRAAVSLIEAELACLPLSFDAKRLATGEAGLRTARARVEVQESAYVTANKEEASLQAELAEVRAPASTAARARSDRLRICG